MDKSQEHIVKVMLDDITFMLYDLERGGFLDIDGSVAVSDAFTVEYKRVELSETLEDDILTTVSDFHISVLYYGNEAIKYVTRGELRMFTLYTFDGFVCGMFIQALETFRKAKFSINN